MSRILIYGRFRIRPLSFRLMLPIEPDHKPSSDNKKNAEEGQPVRELIEDQKTPK